MKNFMLIFRDNAQSEQEYQQLSPEELQADLTKWNTWMGQIAQKEQLMGGEPLLPQGKVLRGKAKQLTDGPFMESKEIVGGYMIIKARDEAEAVEIAKGCPTLDRAEGTVEIREIMELPK